MYSCIYKSVAKQVLYVHINVTIHVVLLWIAIVLRTCMQRNDHDTLSIDHHGYSTLQCTSEMYTVV